MLVPLSHGTAVNNGHEEKVVYASTAEGRWGKKEKRKKEKKKNAPVFTPSCVTPAGSCYTDKLKV